MNNKKLYILVEGENDTQFINAFIHKCLTHKYKKITCVEYGEKSSGKVKNRIKSYEEAGDDYFFFADADFHNKPMCFPKKKEELSKIYSIPIDKIWIVINVIESWYLAGFNKEFCKKEKIRYLKNTDRITKKDFVKIAEEKYGKNKKSPKQLRNLLANRKKEHFSFQEVIKKKRNQSLKRFYLHDHKDFDLKCE